MKLTDLMVGDYIYVGETRSNMDGDYDVFFKDRPITIEDFKFWAENDWDENDYNEFLAPIPLTTEILEKNGFEDSIYASLHTFYYNKKPIISLFENMDLGNYICKREDIYKKNNPIYEYFE